MEIKKIVEGMTAPEVAATIEANFVAMDNEKADKETVMGFIDGLEKEMDELSHSVAETLTGKDSSETIYVDGPGGSQKQWTQILGNIVTVPPIKITAETDITYTGTSASTFLSLDSKVVGATGNPANIIAPISGTKGQVISKGTVIFDFAGQSFGEARDIFVGVRYSGRLKIVIVGEKIEGISDRVDENTAKISANTARISALENASSPTRTILDAYAVQIQRARQAGYRSPVMEGEYPIKPMAFMHISDTHTSRPNTRAIEVLNYLGANGHVKFLMHTGDLLEDPKRNPPAWSGVVAEAQYPVFVTIGNHDVGNWASAPAQYKTDDQIYADFVSPQIGTWGLKTDGGGTPHPNVKNYYFKDWTDEKVRLIVVYEYEIPSVETQQDAGRGARWMSQEQVDWLLNALMTTPAGYGVILAHHAPEGVKGSDENPFNSLRGRGGNTQQTYQYRDGAVYNSILADIVEGFMNRAAISFAVSQSAASYQNTINVQANFGQLAQGVEFIAHVSGHMHADGVSRIASHPRQLELNINCDTTIESNQRSETLLVEGTTFEDAINVYTIDRNHGEVHILRIGADYDGAGNHKDMLTVKYRE